MRKKLYKRWWFRFGISLLVIIIGSLSFQFVGNVGIAVNPGDFLSIETHVALAAQSESSLVDLITAQELNPGDEVITKRTLASKTHWLEGNSYSWDSTIGSIHYEDSGEWIEIDNIFKPSTAPWDWEMLDAGYHIRVKEDFTAGQIIEFETQGETVQFQPMALEWTNDLNQIQPIAMPKNVIPVITNPEVDLLPTVGVTSHQGTIRWNNGYGDGLDFEWRCTSSKLVKILEVENLSKLPLPEQYILDGVNPVLRLNLIFDPSKDMDIYVDGIKWNKATKKQTFNLIEFRKNDKVLWGFKPLSYWGSSEEEGNEGQSVATLEKRSNKLYISIRVPYEWLQNAVYPVFIDTDVESQVAADEDDCHYRLTTLAFNTWQATIQCGYYNSPNKQHSGGMRFLALQIPAGATINLAHFSLKAANSFTTVDVRTRIRAQAADDPITFSDQADFDARSWTTELVNWDNIGEWVEDTWYDSDDITAVIQEVIDRPGWESGNALVLWWDDHEDRSAAVTNTRRVGYSHNTGSSEAPKLHIQYEAVGPPEITNIGGDWAMGTVSTSTTYWANGSEPSWPLTDPDAKWTVTNNSGASVDIYIKGTNFTGGVGWTLAGSQGQNQVVLIAFKEGDGSGDGITLTTNDQLFINSLADGADIDWELKFMSATSHTDGADKSSTVTITAELE